MTEIQINLKLKVMIPDEGIEENLLAPGIRSQSNIYNPNSNFSIKLSEKQDFYSSKNSLQFSGFVVSYCQTLAYPHE